jgi:hypothetical protein
MKGYTSVKYDMLTFWSTLTDCLGTNDMKKLQVTSKQHRAHMCQIKGRIDNIKASSKNVYTSGV